MPYTKPYSGQTSLENDSSVTVKQADKGDSLVVQNHKDHLDESFRLLADTDTYTILPRDPLPEFQLGLRDIVDATKDGVLIKRERLFLLPTLCSTPYFYHLPKVLKSL